MFEKVKKLLSAILINIWRLSKESTNTKSENEDLFIEKRKRKLENKEKNEGKLCLVKVDFFYNRHK